MTAIQRSRAKGERKALVVTYRQVSTGTGIVVLIVHHTTEPCSARVKTRIVGVRTRVMKKISVR
eukprot:269157-Rhodomonas_salina.1